MSEENMFEENGPLPVDRVRDLSELCKRHKKVEAELEDLELKIKNKKAELEIISRQSIPSIFNELGLRELKLSSGEKVSVEDKLKASIADKNYQLAYRGMVNKEGGDVDAETKIDSLFSTTIIVEETDEETLGILIENNIPYEMKRSIHYQTLAKYCREKLDNGDTIPEGITVFQYQETKIK